MTKYRSLLLLIILAITVLSSRITLADQEYANDQATREHNPTAEQMIVDGLIYRPLALAGTAIGLGIFIATLPFSVIGDNVGQAGQELVVKPAHNTFGRCLGCLPSHSDSRQRY